MRRGYLIAITALVACGVAAGAAWAASKYGQVHARVYDPAKTHLAQSGWVSGIGCPTGAGVSTTGGSSPDSTYTDPACPTGDSKDNTVEGLLMAKTGPTANFAAGVADLKNVKKIAVTELGYDLRKPVSTADPRGSHCGAGAPRFDIVLTSGKSYFIGCNSPPPTTQTAGNGWLRLRWGGGGTLMAFNADTGALENISGESVSAIELVFDEGQDTGPDNFGLAVLDNVDVNGVLVGQGNKPTG